MSLRFLVLFLTVFHSTNSFSVRTKSNQFYQSSDHFDSSISSPRKPGFINNKLPDKPEKRLPEAIIIGVKKGGTRALLEYLRLNPRIKAPGPEVHFFDRHYERGLDWYRKQMPSVLPNQVLLEKTPSYFITKSAPERIYRMNPKIKLLVVVRDPVTRAISDYTQTASKRPGMPSFEEMAFNLTSNGRLAVNKSWGAIRIGIYHRHLKRWLKYFPLSQLHFVSGERLISDPAGEVRSVERFLGLPPFIRNQHFVFSQEKGFPCLRKSSKLTSNSTAVSSLTSSSLQASTLTKPHCLGKTKGRTHPDIDPLLLDRLRAFFSPHNDKFYRMVKRDFKW